MENESRALEYNRRKHPDVTSVRRLQQVIGATADGVWGPKTVRRVTKWQTANGLTADGMVGPATMRGIEAQAARIPSMRRPAPRTKSKAQGVAIVNGLDLEPPVKDWTNYRAADVRLFKHRKRKPQTTTEIVVHESVTRSRATTQRILDKRNLGVHLMIDADGSVSQHADLAAHRLVHCRSHNGPSVGVEVINPYEPRHLREGSPWTQVMDPAPWAHTRKYVMATEAQCVTLAAVIDWLVDLELVEIPRVFWGVHTNPRRWYLSQVPGTDGSDENDLADRHPGIWSHEQIGDHSDGSWPLLVAYLILSRGMSPGDAYAYAAGIARDSRRYADL